MREETEELLTQLLQDLQSRTDEWLEKNKKFCNAHGFFDEEHGSFYLKNIEKSDAPEFIKLYFRIKTKGIIMAVHPFMVSFK
jgi:hypothetical protein